MVYGEVKCSCGQYFNFDTTEENVQCPACKKFHKAALYAVVFVTAEETPVELPKEEIPAEVTEKVSEEVSADVSATVSANVSPSIVVKGVE